MKNIAHCLSLVLVIILMNLGCGYHPNSFYPVAAAQCDSLSNDGNATSLTFIDSTGSETDIDFYQNDVSGVLWKWDISGSTYTKSAPTAECYLNQEKKVYCLLRIAYCSPNLQMPGIGTYQWINPLVHDTDVGVTLTFRVQGRSDDVYYADSGMLIVLESVLSSDSQIKIVYFGTLINDSGKKLRIKCGKYSWQHTR